MLQRLYFHCDISIGNLLVALTPNVIEEFDPRYQEEDWEVKYEHMGLLEEPTTAEVEEQVGKLEEILKELGVSNLCYGSVIDGDMMSDLRTHWDSPPSDHKAVSRQAQSTRTR